MAVIGNVTRIYFPNDSVSVLVDNRSACSVSGQLTTVLHPVILEIQSGRANLNDVSTALSKIVSPLTDATKIAHGGIRSSLTEISSSLEKFRVALLRSSIPDAETAYGRISFAFGQLDAQCKAIAP
jgi:hypothetical protein